MPNAAPTAVADAAALTVGPNAQVSGNVLLNDTDPEGDALSVSAVGGNAAAVGTTIAGNYGSLVLQTNGSYAYVLSANNPMLQALGRGQSVTDVFRYTLSDGFDHSTSTTTITNRNLIAHSEAFDAAAWVKLWGTGVAPSLLANVASGPTGGASTADQLTLNGGNRGLFINTDAAGLSTFSVWVRLVSGDGRFGLNYYDGGVGSQFKAFVATSEWQRISLTFQGSGSVNGNVALGHGPDQTGSGVFQIWGAQLNPGGAPTDYLPTAGAPAVTTATTVTPLEVATELTITIDGASSTNLAPEATGDAAVVGRAGPGQATGNVLLNDHDPDGDVLTVAAVNGQAAGVGAVIQGRYGSLVLGANGDYAYVLGSGPAVQALAPGQKAVDSFSYTVSDGSTHAEIRSVITGENLIPQSETFDHPTWVRFGPSGGQPTVVANVAAGPLGGEATAERITLTASGSGLYYQTPINGECTFSVWVRLVSGDGSFGLNYYDGLTGAVFRPFQATGEWQRFSVTFNGNGLSADNVAFMRGAQGGAGVFEIWGAQLNRGAAPTDYAPTHGHFDKVYADAPAPVTVTARLDITVEGPDPGAGTTGVLNFAGGPDGVIVDLAAGTWSHALKVLPLGDSITLGNTTPQIPAGSETGYRTTLWWQLAGERTPINFVGPRSAGDSDLPDRDHFGVPGYRSDQLAAALPGLIDSARPDAILLMGGTNDVFEETAPVARVLQSINDMIATVTEMSPATRLYVATLTPISPTLDPVDSAMVNTVNAAIRETVAQAAARGANVSLVDTSSITPSDLADFAHLTASGYNKLGMVWADALAEQAADGRTLHDIGPGITRVVGTDNNDLLIGGDTDAWLQGGGGYDILQSGGGRDTLTGGGGTDLFVISRTSERVVITDFNPLQQDHLVFEGYAGLTSVSQLAAHTRVTGGDTIIDMSAFGSDVEIQLTGFTSSLKPADVWIL